MVHQFWNDKPLEVVYEKEKVVKQICSLFFEKPAVSNSLVWSEICDDSSDLSELTIFIQENYMQNGFPFQIVYSTHHLRHELSVKPSNVILLRQRVHARESESESEAKTELKGKGSIIACIMGSVRQYELNLGGKTAQSQSKIDLCDTLLINFLCVHKKFRHLRLAPALITEISRRANEDWGIQKAYYISLAELPNPFCKASYHHRILDTKRCELSKYYSASETERERWSTSLVESKRKYHVQWVSDECGPSGGATVDFSTLNKIVDLVNTFHTTNKQLYELLTVEALKRVLESPIMDSCIVYDKLKGDVVAFISVSHQHYRVCVESDFPKDDHLKTVVIYQYGFVDMDDAVPIMREVFAESSAVKWDVFTTTDSDIIDQNYIGGHSFYHYMYNVRMFEMRSHKVTLCGL